MAAAYRASLAETPLEHARKLKRQNRAIIVFLVLVIAVFGLFVWLS